MIAVLQASERLEAFINKIMQRAELMNATKEEQIVKKQQILEELQKVGNLLLDSVPRTSSRRSLHQHAPAAGYSPDDDAVAGGTSVN